MRRVYGQVSTRSFQIDLFRGVYPPPFWRKRAWKIPRRVFVMPCCIPRASVGYIPGNSCRDVCCAWLCTRYKGVCQEFHPGGFTQLANMSFDKIFDLTARVYFYIYDIPGTLFYAWKTTQGGVLCTVICTRYVCIYTWYIYVFFFSHTCTFQLLDKPWAQVSSLLPPGSCLHFSSRIGFSNPTACLFFIECC